MRTQKVGYTVIYAGCAHCEIVLLTSKVEGSTLGLDSFHESKAERFVNNVKVNRTIRPELFYERISPC